LIRVAPIQQIACLITNAGISLHDRHAFVEQGIDVLIAHV
jgi:hypothetical protein